MSAPLRAGSELDRLRDAMEQTKALYEGAKAEYDRAVQLANDLGMDHPDGSLRHAAKIHTFTLDLYRDALIKYNRYILDRTPPIA
jgi:hypothetical protein